MRGFGYWLNLTSRVPGITLHLLLDLCPVRSFWNLSSSGDLMPKICICYTWSIIQIFFSVSHSTGPWSVCQSYWSPFYPLNSCPFWEGALTTWVSIPVVMVTLAHSPVLTSHSAEVAHVLLVRWLCQNLIMYEFFLPVHSVYIPVPGFQEKVCICQNCSWTFCNANF